MSTPEQRAAWCKYREVQKARSLANNRCIACHKRHPAKGRKMCGYCAKGARLRIAAKLVNARKQGLCRKCKTQNANGTTCATCAAELLSYGQKRRAQAKIDGRCVSCFHNSPAPGLVSCRECIERISAGNTARRLARKERP
jgi:hypothetical protein